MEAALIRRELENRYRASSHQISVYWIKHESRDALSRELRSISDDAVIVPIVVRVPGFDNPNSIFNDLNSVIQLAEGDLSNDAVAKCVSNGARVILVLIAKTELKIAQTSSPVRLPSWFPVYGGEIVEVLIVDLTWSVSCPISHQCIRLDEINALVYELDCLVSKFLYDFSKVRKLDRYLGFARCVQKSPELSLREVVDQSEADLSKVSGASSYRLSLRAPKTPLSMICQVVQSSSIDKAPGAVGEVLSASLGFRVCVPISMMSLLARPRVDSRDPAIFEWSSFCWAVYFSYQLSTAAAHADQYPTQPYHVLIAYSFDLRRYLASVRDRLLSLRLEMENGSCTPGSMANY